MEPKFKIGDKVHCFREDTEAFEPFDFIGTVLKSADSGNDTESDWEYDVSNAPIGIWGGRILIWENEMALEE